MATFHQERVRMSKEVLNARGFTLTELMVTVAILGLVIAAIVNLYMTGNTVGLTSQNRAEAQQDARAAVLMEEDLRLAGSGCPVAGCPTPPPAGPALLKITAASPTAIAFWADLANASATLTAAVNVGVTTLTVDNAAGFTAGDMLILSNEDQWEVLTVVSVAGSTITVSTNTAAAYPIGAQAGRPRLVTYFWNGVNTLFKDAGDGQGLQPLATGIQSFQLTYFDTSDAAIPAANLPANLANIRRIAVSMTDQSAAALNRGTFRLDSSVRPRNL